MARKSEQSIKCNDLAVAKVARAKVTTQRQWTIEGVQGLLLVVKPNGVATYFARYQVGKGTRRVRRLEAIGRHGSTSLADARKKAMERLSAAAHGVDAMAAEQARAGALSLSQLFEERRAKDTDTAARTLDDYKAALERDVLPNLGKRLAHEITPDEFARLLERVEDRAKHAAHKVRSALGSTYRWAQRRRLVTINPLTGLAFTHQSERRKRVLTDTELGRLWRAIDVAEGITTAVRSIIKLAILTGQRNSEAAGMEIAELKDLDSTTPRWDIPGRRMKRKSDDQFVPLTKQAVELVRTALAAPGSNGVHVFPGTTHGRRHGSGWRQEHIGQETVSRAFAKVAETAGLTDLHLHDMRKCITSWLAEHGHATGEVLDAILHHGRKGVTGTHYNFALYEGQVRKALQVWADHVETVGRAEKSEASNVVGIRG